MKRNDIIKFIGSKVKIEMKSNWHYSGKILDVSEETTEIDDIYDGKMLIANSEIATLRLENGR